MRRGNKDFNNVLKPKTTYEGVIKIIDNNDKVIAVEKLSPLINAVKSMKIGE